jgi:hypothetical protein
MSVMLENGVYALMELFNLTIPAHVVKVRGVSTW